MMLTIETVGTVESDGTLTVKSSVPVAPGRHRVVVVIEEAPESPRSDAERASPPSLAKFRGALGAPEAPGNTVVDLRDKERA